MYTSSKTSLKAGQSRHELAKLAYHEVNAEPKLIYNKSRAKSSVTRVAARAAKLREQDSDSILNLNINYVESFGENQMVGRTANGEPWFSVSDQEGSKKPKGFMAFEGSPGRETRNMDVH